MGVLPGGSRIWVTSATFADASKEIRFLTFIGRKQRRTARPPAYAVTHEHHERMGSQRWRPLAGGLTGVLACRLTGVLAGANSRRCRRSARLPGHEWGLRLQPPPAPLNQQSFLLAGPGGRAGRGVRHVTCRQDLTYVICY